MGKSAGARLRSGMELVDSQVFTERGPNSLVPAPLPIRCSYTATQLRECEQGRISPLLGILFLPLTPGSFGTTLSSKCLNTISRVHGCAQKILEQILVADFVGKVMRRKFVFQRCFL